MSEDTETVVEIALPEYRNPEFVRSDNSMIDMEINHPEYGWIPFSATETDIDARSVGPALFQAAFSAAAAFVPPPEPTDEEKRAAMPNVSARQLRLTLIRNGFSLSAIDAAIAALPEGQVKDEAVVEWEYAYEFQRISPTLNNIAAALGISPVQIDAMWAQALVI